MNSIFPPISWARLVAAHLVSALFAVLLSGCGDDAPVVPAQLFFDGYPVMAGALGKPLSRELRFHVYGRGRSLPAKGATVAFGIIKQPENANARFGKSEASTDAGGLATAEFIVGDKPGLYRISAGVQGHPEIESVQLDVLGGVVVAGASQDGWVGARLDERLSVRLESAPGIYLAGDQGEVRFDLRLNPGGATLSNVAAKTDADGYAFTDVNLGDTQGPGEIGISVVSGIPGISAVNYVLPVGFFAIDWWNIIVSLLGGVGLFLFGMRMMSDGLQLVAGDKLRSLLNLLTNNRVMAVGAGAVVTALVQSSSACTVMVVGFVNAGLMRLEQAIGVVMGANIGTTLTAQIIAFKLSNLALPAIAVGVAITFFARRQTVKYWAGIIVGFGILFLGMNIMSGMMGQLRSSTTMISLFEGLNCVPGPSGYVPMLQFLKAISVGLAATLILQSSAATIGMLMAVAGAGLIDPYAAFAILLGDNIGTTITAVLAAIGSGTAAKRAACFHVLFNVCGVLIMMALNYIQWPGQTGRPIFMELANLFTPGEAFRGENLPRFLANAHSLFNVSCTLIFLPFVTFFASLCRLIIRPKSPEEEKRMEQRRVLEPHLLATPSLAIQQAWAEIGVMLGKGREAQSDGFTALASTDAPDWDQAAASARELERETDELQLAITTYLSNISLAGLTDAQSELLPRMIRSVNDVERVADLGRHLSKLGRRVKKRSLPFTPEATVDMERMSALVGEILQLAEKAVTANADGIEVSGGGAIMRQKILVDGKRLDKSVKSMASELRKNHERRHEAGSCDIRSGVVFMDVVNTFARTSGHALNIIEAACSPSKRGQR
ncbi:MAG: Na/Pi cotransporter family protein [Planctomycetota bacterium]|jgi:phosphate:Na+ symporter|nr:Na/Pi cotransporter family protein [Planctomycetota bacterium]